MSSNSSQLGTVGNKLPLPLTITIEYQEYAWSEQYITGRELRQLAGLPDAADLYLAITDPWDDEPVGLDSKVDLGREGVESFYERRPLTLTIDDQTYAWNRQYISGAALRKLGKVDPQHHLYLWLQKPYEDELVHDDTIINLARPGIEHFRVKKKEEDLEVKIKINDQPYSIKRGVYTVAELKKLGKVPAADELSELIGGKLKPLADNASVNVKGGEEFFSCKREGSSS